MEEEKLRVIDFTEYPGPRYSSQTKEDTSGESFYVKKLNPMFYDCYVNHKLLVVDLDGTSGYPSSFLDEAFGELVYDFSEDVVKKYLRIETVSNKIRKDKILEETYPQWEKRRKDKTKVENTISSLKLRMLDSNLKPNYRNGTL